MLEVNSITLSFDTKQQSLGIRRWWPFAKNNKKATPARRTFQYDMRAHASSCNAILGKSGAGKSTLLALIGGYHQASSGDIRWNGESIIHLPPDQRPVTSLFQDHNLFEHLTVEDNIALGLSTSLKLTSQQQKQLTAVLEKVGLKGFQKRLPAELSGGEQQRVALARCLVRQQPILLLDEPFSALDTEIRLEMLALTKSLIDSEGLCTLLVTHNHEDAEILGAHSWYMIHDHLSATQS